MTLISNIRRQPLALVVLSYGPMWVAGVGFLWWGYFLLRILSRTGDDLSISYKPTLVRILDGLLLGLTAWLVASFSISVFMRDVTTFRALGTVQLLLPWIAVSVGSMQQWSFARYVQLANGYALLAGLQGSLAVFMVTVIGHPVSFSTPVSLVLPDSVAAYPGLGPWLSLTLTDLDWFGGPVLRSSAMSVHATWAGGAGSVGVVLSLWLFARARALQGSRGALLHPLIYFATAALSAALVALSYSRSAMAGLFLAASLVLLVRLTSRGWRLRAAVVPLFLAFSAALLSTTLLSTIQGFVAGLRPGSGTVRFALYKETLEATSDGLFHLVVGLGTKSSSDLGISIGSHSTFASLFARGGIVALILFTVLLVARLVGAFLNGQELPLALMACVTFFALTEDVDAGHTVAVGLLLIFARTLGPPQRPSDWQEAPSQYYL